MESSNQPLNICKCGAMSAANTETTMSYTPPFKDMMFVIENLADIARVSQLPGLADSNLDTAGAILDEGAKLAAEVIAPLNALGDQRPSTWHDGHVKATPGFGDAYRQYAEGGWQGISHPTDFGGQGLAKLIASP